jgi:hypothetical protein
LETADVGQCMATVQHIYNAADDPAIIRSRLLVGRMRYKERELTIVQPEMISIHVGFFSGTLDQKNALAGNRFMGLQPRFGGSHVMRRIVAD